MGEAHARHWHGMPIGAAEDLHDLCDDTVACTTRLHQTYGRMVAFPKGGNEATVFAFGPEASESLFSDPDTFHVCGHPGPRNSSMRRFGLGLFGLNGKPVQHTRKLLLPVVSKPAVEASAGSMLALLESYLGSWTIGQTIDLSAEMKKLALRITGRLLFGLEDFAIAERVAGTFQEWLDDYIRVLFAMAFPIDLPQERYHNWLAVGDRLEAELKELIRQRSETLRDDQIDVLAVLLKARRAGDLSEADLTGQMHTLFNAAYQTTASGLLWALLMLVQHPEVLRGVMQEAAIPRQPTVGESTLLDRAIRESLRLFPPVTFVLRRATRPARVAGFDVPTGTIVFLGLYTTHHLADVYPNPQHYLPDRWIKHKASPYAYIPFGAGPRMCLGTAFSRQLFQSVVPTVLRRYRLALRPHQRVDRYTSLTLGVSGSLPVTLLRPDGQFHTVPLTGNIHEMVQLPSPTISLPRAA